jgi:hypothetical protein
MGRPNSGTRPAGWLTPWTSSAGGRLLLAAAGLLLLLAIVLPGVAFVRMMSPSGPPPAGQSELSRTRVGDPIEVAVQLGGRRSDGRFSARLLEPGGNGSYRTTGRLLTVAPASDLTVTMGGARDLKAGAVVQVKGVLSAPYTVTAHQATVLTGFVQVRG